MEQKNTSYMKIQALSALFTFDWIQWRMC